MSHIPDEQLQPGGPSGQQGGPGERKADQRVEDKSSPAAQPQPSQRQRDEDPFGADEPE